MRLVPQSCTEELHVKAPIPLADITLLWFCLNDENPLIIQCSEINGFVTATPALEPDSPFCCP